MQALRTSRFAGAPVARPTARPVAARPARSSAVKCQAFKVTFKTPSGEKAIEVSVSVAEGGEGGRAVRELQMGGEARPLAHTQLTSPPHRFAPPIARSRTPTSWTPPRCVRRHGARALPWW